MMTFCEECHDMVAYITKNVKMEKSIKLKEIAFEGKEAICPICNNLLFVASIRDFNLQQLDHAYRTAEDLITVSEIEQILEKFKIGKRPLSTLLGWGEVTLTRYLDGAIPTKEYSDKLKGILHDHGLMDSILDKNRAAITIPTYKKCKDAIEVQRVHSLSGSHSENKIESVTKYLLLNASEITPLALQKLLYYIQGFNKVFNGVFLFDDDCEAWSHGPVYTNIYHRYKNFGYNPIDIAIDYDESLLNISTSEKEVLDTVIRNFGCYSGRILERMTHSEPPWLSTRNGLSDTAPSNATIEKGLIEQYFEQIRRKYNMLSTSDVCDYSRELFEKLAQ